MNLLDQIEAILNRQLSEARWFELESAAKEIHDFVIETYGPTF